MTDARTSPKATNLLQDKSPIYTSKPFKDYQLQINDEIYCSILTSNKDFSDVFNGVLSSTDLSTKASYAIFESGNISIPFFGDIQILGLTIPEAEEVIQNKMRQAIPDAQVKIFLKKKLQNIEKLFLEHTKCWMYGTIKLYLMLKNIDLFARYLEGNGIYQKLISQVN